MIPGEIFTSFAEFQGIVSVNDFWFPLGFQELCKLLWVSCEVLFLHGYAWIHWVARSCTTTAYRWLFRDSQLSLRTLWSAVNKSPKFTARGTASPLRLLHGALVILVRLQISQFRSLGKWVWTLCLPKSSRLFVVGSKETSWEELAWESPCSRISSSTKFSLNSCSHSWISEYSDPLIRISVSSQCFPSDNTAGVFPLNFIVKNLFNSLTYTIAPSCVCTSPLAVMTLVGLHDFVKESISASLRSFLLIMCIDAPESTTNSLSSSFNVDARRHPFSGDEKNAALSCSFSLNTLLGSFHAACSCHSVSSWERSSNFGAFGLRWWNSLGQM